MLLAILVTGPVYAHVVSMSTGELRVDGPTATYELRMPMYEVAHVTRALLAGHAAPGELTVLDREVDPPRGPD